MTSRRMLKVGKIVNCEPHDEWTRHETNKHSRIGKTNIKTRTTRHNDGSRTRAGNVRMRFYAGNVCDSLKIFERAVVFVYFHPPRHRARSRVSHCSGARIHRANRFLKTRGVMIKNTVKWKIPHLMWVYGGTAICRGTSSWWISHTNITFSANEPVLRRWL